MIPSSPQWRGWSLFLCGFCMGAADLIPGISGGTVAFLFGFYSSLLDSLKTLNLSALQHLLTGRWTLFSQQVAWRFLLPLSGGIGCAFIALSSFFQFILTHEVYRVYLYASFFGLIGGSIFLCMRQIHSWNHQMWVGVFLGAIIAYFLTDSTLLPAPEGEYAVEMKIELPSLSIRNYDTNHHLLTGLSSHTLSLLLEQGLLQENTPVYNQQRILIGLVGEMVTPSRSFSLFNGWLVTCGALAVCALLLPGISGSYLLTLLGVYPVVIEALVDFLQHLKTYSFDSEAFSVLWSLGLGIIFGMAAFSRLLSRLLHDLPSQTFAVLSGFMIGAIRSVWPFWSYEYVMLPLKLYKGPQLVTLHPFFPDWNSPLIWQAAACACASFLVLCYIPNEKTNDVKHRL